MGKYSNIFHATMQKHGVRIPPFFFAARNQPLGVSIGDPGDPPTLFKFSKMIFQFGELVQNFELKRVGVALKGHQFAPLPTMNPKPIEDGLVLTFFISFHFISMVVF